MQTCRIKLQHNHIADTAVVQCAIAVDKIKLRAACLRDKPAVIVAEGLKDLPDTARCAMLSANSIKRTLQLSDCSTSAQTAIAKHLHHRLNEWQHAGDPACNRFLRYNSGPQSDSCIVAFTTDNSV